MYPNKRAFTLIELLVVVLIIGLLASVALPQYQVAVLKSRLATTMSGVKTISQAAELYFLEHGEYAPDDITVLDIDFSACDQSMSEGRAWCGKIKYDYNAGDGSILGFTDWHNLHQEDRVSGEIHGAVKDNQTRQLLYIQFLQHSPKYASRRFCVAIDNSSVSHKVCKSLGGILAGHGLANNDGAANNVYQLP